MRPPRWVLGPEVRLLEGGEWVSEQHRNIRGTLSFAIGLVLLGVLFTCGQAAAGGDDWTLRKNEEGIKVWTREGRTSSFDEYRAETIVNAPLTVPVSYAFDPETWQKWIHSCGKARLVKQNSPVDLVAQVQVNAPWPATDRESTSRNVLVQEPETLVVTITMKAIPDAGPPLKGHVRVAAMDGSWLFEPLPGGRTRVVYTVAADPGGDVPALLANLVVIEQPFETLSGLRKLCRSGTRLPSLSEAIKDP